MKGYNVTSYVHIRIQLQKLYSLTRVPGTRSAAAMRCCCSLATLLLAVGGFAPLLLCFCLLLLLLTPLTAPLDVASYCCVLTASRRRAPLPPMRHSRPAHTPIRMLPCAPLQWLVLCARPCMWWLVLLHVGLAQLVRANCYLVRG